MCVTWWWVLERSEGEVRFGTVPRSRHRLLNSAVLIFVISLIFKVGFQRFGSPLSLEFLD